MTVGGRLSRRSLKFPDGAAAALQKGRLSAALFVLVVAGLDPAIKQGELHRLAKVVAVGEGEAIGIHHLGPCGDKVFRELFF